MLSIISSMLIFVHVLSLCSVCYKEEKEIGDMECVNVVACHFRDLLWPIVLSNCACFAHPL